MPEIARYDNAWAGLISRVSFGKGLVDMVNGQKLSFVRPGAGLKRFEQELVALGANVPIVEKNGQVLRLEGPATNKVTCAKSNPAGLTNISKSGDAAAVLSVVNDATALAAAGLSACGPNVYKLDNSAGSSVAQAIPSGSVGNTNNHSLSAFTRGSGLVKARLAGDSGTYQTLSSAYSRIKNENQTPSDSSRGLVIEAAAGSVVYFLLPQLEEGPVCTSPIPGGTGAITRASAGADTSGNGLSLALNQQMVDSLVGERMGLSTAWTEEGSGGPYITQSSDKRTLTWSAGYGASRTAYKGGLVPGQTFEVQFVLSVTSGSKGVRVRLGSGGASAEYTANGLCTFRGICSGSANLNLIGLNDFSGSVVFNYCRRVLDSGQTNPGEGTICQWVDLPWNSSAVANSSWINIFNTTNDVAYALSYRKPSDGTFFIRLFDGASVAEAPKGAVVAGRYCLISQWSAALGKMRVGLYNPATRTLQWSSPTLAGATAYRGFFLIYGTGNQQRMRWGYGLSNLPIGLIEMRWFNRILSNSEVLYHAQEGLL